MIFLIKSGVSCQNQIRAILIMTSTTGPFALRSCGSANTQFMQQAIQSPRSISLIVGPNLSIGFSLLFFIFFFLDQCTSRTKYQNNISSQHLYGNGARITNIILKFIFYVIFDWVQIWQKQFIYGPGFQRRTFVDKTFVDVFRDKNSSIKVHGPYTNALQQILVNIYI